MTLHLILGIIVLVGTLGGFLYAVWNDLIRGNDGTA
jgi:hypothetical protein